MNKKKYKKRATTRQVNEPATVYNSSGKSKRQITFFNSFDEAETDNYKWLASLSPEEHLKNATILIKRIFAQDLKNNPKLGFILHF